MSTSSESLLRANLDLPDPQSLLVPLHVLQLEQFMILVLNNTVKTTISQITGGYDRVIFSVSRGTVGVERLMRS